MEENKKRNVSTKICVIIIIILLLAFGGLYYQYKYPKTIINRKEAITSEQFKEYINTKGFDIYDAQTYSKNFTDSFFKDGVKSGYYTSSNDSKDCTINFCEMNDENHTLYEYYYEILTIEKNNNGEFIENYESGDNYLKYTAMTNGYYVVMVRVDNTILYGQIKSDEKETLDNILNDFNF